MCFKLIKHFQWAFKSGHSPQNMLKLSASTFHSSEFSQKCFLPSFFKPCDWKRSLKQLICQEPRTQFVLVSSLPEAVPQWKRRWRPATGLSLPQPQWHVLLLLSMHWPYYQFYCKGLLKIHVKPVWERERVGKEEGNEMLFCGSLALCLSNRSSGS